MEQPHRAVITVWSDYVCPFCYLELPVLERIQRELGDRVLIEWKAFELRPDPEPLLDPEGDYLRDIWGRAVYPMAEVRGLALKLPPVQPRSKKALEAAEFARAEGRFDEMNRALFRAFFEQGRDLGDPDVLVTIAQSIGLNGEALRFSLDLGEFTRKVEQDREAAAGFGIEAVPVLWVRNEKVPLEKSFRVDGAADFKTLKRAVERALHAAPDARRAEI